MLSFPITRSASLALTLVATAACGSRSALIVPPPPVELALGGSHSCARMSDHTVRCWGRNDHGELGDGTTTLRARPTPVLSLVDVEQVAIGQNHACALRRDGSVMCWGGNATGMLGDGTMTDRATPATVVDLSNVARIAVGGNDTSCAVLRDGAVRCWGNDTWRAHAIPDGDAGFTFNRDDNDICLYPPLPDGGLSGFSCRMRPRVVRGIDDAVDIAINETSACALRRDGSVRCWGRVDRTPFETTELAAVPMRGLADVVQIAMMGSNGCALDRAGAVRCWGNLGANHTDADGPVPLRIDALDGAIAIAMELIGVCVLREDRSVACLVVPDFASPALVDIAELQGARSIAGGFGHLCGAFGGDDVRCLGENHFGQLGVGNTEEQRGVVSVVW